MLLFTFYILLETTVNVSSQHQLLKFLQNAEKQKTIESI
jgi:hypothetical protein